MGGGRLSGKIAETDVGLLAMRTEALDGAAGETFSVARLKRNVLGSSDVGVMVTNRAGGGEHNTAWGADANLRRVRMARPAQRHLQIPAATRAAGAARLEAEAGELRGNILRCDRVASRASVAALELVAGEELDMAVNPVRRGILCE